ncbi:MAG: tRNA(His) guanylyltransferase Thg1 family protein [Nannocystales bacterium]
MKFNELDARMRVFETVNEQRVLPGVYAVARLDGRSFTRLTKDVHNFAAPFDPRFRDMMVETTRYLMGETGMSFAYGFTQSDEISLLFSPHDQSFGRKLRKLGSVLAGEASAKFTSLLGSVAAFDCRLSQLPSRTLVLDYFRWRSADAHRNSLSAHCYWILREDGATPGDATARLEGCSAAQKNELLFSRGVNFNQLPLWQRRGVGVVWEAYEKEGLNPTSGEKTCAQRRRLVAVMQLPMKDAYEAFVSRFVNPSA